MLLFELIKLITSVNFFSNLSSKLKFSTGADGYTFRVGVIIKLDKKFEKTTEKKSPACMIKVDKLWKF